MNLLATGRSEKYLARLMENLTGSKSTYCGFMLDSARCEESRAYYRNAIDFAANRGMSVILWHFSDDQGCSLEFDSVPGIASPNAYSKAEMRELIQYARDRNIEIVPELASLGHSRYLTRLPAYRHLNEAEAHFTGMCPVSRETRTVIRALIEETIEVFDSPNFHVGMDEVNIGEHPLTRAALETSTKSELLTDYLQFLHGVVSAKGRRMWMWGDMLLKYPQMVADIPGDILICNWQYEPHPSPATTQTLLDAGFDVMLCSALISHDQTLFPGELFALPNIRTLESHRSLTPATGHGRVVGHINTIWTPVRFLADSLWVALDLAAAVIGDDKNIDATQQAARFSQNFYGLNAEHASQFAQAVSLLLKHSPTRLDWISIAKLQPLSASAMVRAKAASAAWSRANDLLASVYSAVQDHLDEYRAFALLIQMLDHTYAAAIGSEGDSLPEQIETGQQIVHRIDRNWDRERFADDSRKFTAPIASFQDDHLIPLLQTGLAALKKKLKESTPTRIMTDVETFAV